MHGARLILRTRVCNGRPDPISRCHGARPDSFLINRLNKTPIVLPITRGDNFARTAGFAVSLMGAGTNATGIVRCDQPRTIDLGSRNARKLESVPPAIMDEVLAKLAAILE